MVNLHAYLCCVCVRPAKCEMTYKVTYGNVSRILRKSVDLGGLNHNEQPYFDELYNQETRAAHFLPVL
jgi:hypothetical protein